MKIRQGFVSNSSSSSFCIYGVYKEESEMIDAFIAKGWGTEDEFADGVGEWLWDCSSTYQLKEKGFSEKEIEEKLASRPLKDFDYQNVNGECHYLGIGWSDIKDDETGAEFKARIDAQMKELFGEDTVCCTHEEAWYPC